jgi:hypothetical protein
MHTLVKEETVNTTKSCNPLGSFLDAQERSKQAFKQHKNKFDTNQHVDRVVQVCNILEKFFGRPVTYLTYRGIGTRKPFENIKMEQVGHILSRTPTNVKNDNLYAPLLALGNVEVLSKNGHLTVRVY